MYNTVYIYEASSEQIGFFDFAWSYKEPLFTLGPCAWLYVVDIAIFVWVIHRWTSLACQ